MLKLLLFICSICLALEASEIVIFVLNPSSPHTSTINHQIVSIPAFLQSVSPPPSSWWLHSYFRISITAHLDNHNSLSTPSSTCLIHCWHISEISWWYYPAERTSLALHCLQDKVQIPLVHGTRPSMPWPPLTTPALLHFTPLVVVYALNLPDNSANQVDCCKPLDHAAVYA